MMANLFDILIASGLGAPRAYIDPNTGGMLFQVLAMALAAFSGILIFFSRQIKAGVARLRRGLRKDEPPQDSNEKRK
jgi:hypothetical protein